MQQIGLGTAALGRPQYINLRQGDSNNTDLKAFREQSFFCFRKSIYAWCSVF